MVSDSRRPVESVTRVCHTWVRRPRCSGVASARTVPDLPAAKKFVLDSSVVVLAPAGRFRNVAAAPTVNLPAGASTTTLESKTNFFAAGGEIQKRGRGATFLNL